MADEAFALSPISARAAQPSEADYDAIQEAFMETSRGRWFLGEYAKRNRNADTKMVLDAVSRIEETIAASKKPVRDPLLDEALASLRTALAQARDSATAAVDGLALEQNLAPVRKGARVIREIAWRLREIGADGRICDLIESQLTAIEDATGKLTPAELAGALSEAFDRIEGKIAALAPDEVASPAATGRPAEAAPNTAPRAEAQAGLQVKPAEAHATMAASSAETETGAEAGMASAEPASPSESPLAAAEASSEPADAFDAHDEAMLDMVALEMAAPDTDAAYEPKLEDADVYESQLHATQSGQDEAQDKVQDIPEESRPNGVQARSLNGSAASWEIDVTFGPETGHAIEQPVAAAALAPVPPLQAVPDPEPVMASEPEPSLGSSLLAHGIVPRPRSSRPDPLAPIRRMSQNEKIAFFS